MLFGVDYVMFGLCYLVGYVIFMLSYFLGYDSCLGYVIIHVMSVFRLCYFDWIMFFWDYDMFWLGLFNVMLFFRL